MKIIDNIYAHVPKNCVKVCGEISQERFATIPAKTGNFAFVFSG